MRNSWGVAAACLLSAVASPAEAQQVHRIDTPRGTLQQAVLALGKQARISIAIVDPSLGRIRVPRVSGRMTAEQALRRMLAGSPASFIALGGSSYRIVRASSAPRQRRSPPQRARPSPSPPPPPEQSAEIIVTASKRDVPLRNYPGPATVVAGDVFAAGSAIEGTDAIAERVPSLGSTHLGPGRDKLFIRSIADSSFTGQTQSTVGQYFGEARVNYNAPDPDLRLYDVASVEILPGPQGTLYGAGAMGGVLRIVPNRPDRDSAIASLSASVASTRHGGLSRELAAVANLPLAPGGAGVRLVAYDLSEAGYIDDIGRSKKDVNRTRIRGGRVIATADIATGWSAEAGGVYQRIDGRDGQYADRALPDLTRMTFFAQPFSNDYALGYLTLRGTLRDVQLISTVSAASHDLVEDFDATLQDDEPTLFRQRNRPTLLSTETRISRSRDDGSGWLAGVQLLRNRSRLDRWSGPAEELAPLLGVRNAIDEQTLFGEYSYRPAPRISLTAGLRLSHVKFSGRAIGPPVLQVDGPSSASGTDLRLLPSLAAGFDAGRGIAVYLRYQESFRPGGLIVRSEAVQELESDHIAAWEAGLRFGQRAGSAFSGALAVSYARWTDIQADTIDTTGLPSTINIGDGNILSFEGRADWRPLPNLAFGLAATVNRSRVNNPDPGIIIVENAPLPNVPDIVARFGVDYRRGVSGIGDLRLSGWANYVGKSWLGIGPILGREQGDFLNTGVEARLGRADRYLFLRATNLLDSIGNRFALGSVFSIVFEDQITPLRPRTVRLGFHTAF